MNNKNHQRVRHQRFPNTFHLMHPATIKSNRGEVLTIWWFGVLAIAGIGVVIGTVLFYSNSIDVRGIESEALANKIINCFNDLGNKDIDFIDNGFDIFKECKLKKQLFDNGIYFADITLTSQAPLTSREDVAEAEKNYKYGNNALEKNCEIAEKTIAKNFPKCSAKMTFIYNPNGDKILVSVLASSNNNGGTFSNEE